MNPRPDLCEQASVRKYPTWVIKGTRHEGVMTLDEIAQVAGYTPPATR